MSHWNIMTCLTIFNRICFLMIYKEAPQWHSAYLYPQYKIGMAVAQSYGLQLISHGLLSFKEFFNQCFGVYSQKNIVGKIKSVADSCGNIFMLFQSLLICKNLKITIKEKQEPGEPLQLNAEHAHQALIAVYGGESESDGEDYNEKYTINWQVNPEAFSALDESPPESDDEKMMDLCTPQKKPKRARSHSPISHSPY